MKTYVTSCRSLWERVEAIAIDYFEVFDGDKRLSLKRTGFGGWFITNRRGQDVRSGGPTGKRLIQAVLNR
ncbi:hypothetical protein KL864_33980 [Mycolicibacterium goodii]|uniref:hypothetical protein n=1 Tax=Mycolicibacterium goodii TaxID=134601 RepID=UPI001BDD8957|nr:hypothetical protein [Mycolicibacterium goodii]MBU8820877.1 hypothetical protein [Mycolicibacterium goodii]